MKKWVLLTVSRGGEIRENTFDSENMALQAKSLALTGMTIEEDKKAEREYRANPHSGSSNSPCYGAGDLGYDFIRGRWVQRHMGQIVSARIFTEDLP